MRYGYAYQQQGQNYSRDIPFSDRGGERVRYRNHNYDGFSNNPGDRLGNQGLNRYNDPINNNLNPQDPYRQGDGYNRNNEPSPFSRSNNNQNPNDPYNRQFPDGRARNPFENPYQSNRDRYNLNDRNIERERFQQERRYQIELEKLRNLLVETDQRGSLECTANVAAQWNFETNVNEITQTEAVSKRGESLGRCICVAKNTVCVWVLFSSS